MPVPVAAQSKAQVCGRSPAEIVGSNPAGGHGCLFECCVLKVEVSTTGWSLVQTSATDYGVSLCVISKNLKNEEAIIPRLGCKRHKIKKIKGDAVGIA